MQQRQTGDAPRSDLARLAASINNSARVQKQSEQAVEIGASAAVQAQAKASASINQPSFSAQLPAAQFKPALQARGVAIQDEAGPEPAVEAMSAKAMAAQMQAGGMGPKMNVAQRAVQRAKIKQEGEWKEVKINFAELSADEARNIRNSIYSPFTPEGIYQLSRAELGELSNRERVLRSSDEAKEARAKKAAEDDAAAFRLLEAEFKATSEWKFDGAPSHMGDSDRGFRQNWEQAFLIGSRRGVLHLHFNTNEKSSISAATLGRAHIKTTLTSRAGNFEAPEAMVTQAIEAIPRT